MWIHATVKSSAKPFILWSKEAQAFSSAAVALVRAESSALFVLSAQQGFQQWPA